MAQAAELTLSFAVKQIETVHQNKNAGQFLGRDFQLVGKKVGYFDLIESLQKCIHAAKEKNYKRVANKAFDRLKEIAIAQTLAHPDKIELIDIVARAALNPSLMFEAKISMDEILLRKALTLLLLAREFFLNQTYYSQSKLRCIAANAKISNLTPLVETGQVTLFDFGARGTNCTALLLQFEGFAAYDVGEKTQFGIDNLTDEDVQLVQSHAHNEDPKVRDFVAQILSFHERNCLIRQHDFVFDAIHNPALQKSADIVNPHLTFLDTYFPPIQLGHNNPKLTVKSDMDVEPHKLWIEINEDVKKFDPYLRFVYRYFHTELMHRFAKSGKPADTTSSFPSLFKPGPNFALPLPEQMTAFLEERRLAMENHPKAPKREAKKLMENYLGPAKPYERKQEEEEEPLEAAPPKKENRPVLKLGPVDLNYSMAAASAPVSSVVADQPAAAAPGFTWANKGVAMAAAPAYADQPAAAASGLTWAKKGGAMAAAPALDDFDSIEALLAHQHAPKIIYSDRVGQYLEAPSHEIDSHWRHAFPLQLDAFLGNDSYVKKSTWTNTKTKHPDTLYIMIGEVEVSKDNWKLCQFEWCVGEDGKCYHHFCSFNPNVLQNWMSGKAFLPENFPTLEESYRDATWKGVVSKKVQENMQMELDPVWKYITFTNQETNISCKIFKRGK